MSYSDNHSQPHASRLSRESRATGARNRGAAQPSGTAMHMSQRSAQSNSRARYALGSNHNTRTQGPYHGPRGTYSRPVPSRFSGSRGQGGYQLRQRPINFGGSRRVGSFLVNQRLLILGALAVVLLILCVVIVSSCVRSCASSQEPAKEINSIDARVEAGASEALTKKLASALDRGEDMQTIAEQATKYGDEGLIDLAISEPLATHFVAKYPDLSSEAASYGESASAGTVPLLYTWDERWGATTYLSRPFALTGSGPTAFGMAVIGLTGSTDNTPATFAAKVDSDGFAGGDSGMAAGFIEKEASNYGLTFRAYTSSTDNINHILTNGVCLLMEVRAGSLTNEAHWVLLVAKQDDGSIVVYDPSSSEVSSKTWSPDSLASAAENFYAVSASQTANTANSEGDQS